MSAWGNTLHTIYTWILCWLGSHPMTSHYVYNNVTKSRVWRASCSATWGSNCDCQLVSTACLSFDCNHNVIWSVGFERWLDVRCGMNQQGSKWPSVQVEYEDGQGDAGKRPGTSYRLCNGWGFPACLMLPVGCKRKKGIADNNEGPKSRRGHCLMS